MSGTEPQALVAAASCQTPAQLLERIARALAQYRYRFASETQLHAGIAQALEAQGFAYEHELRASPTCRYDFWLPEPRLVIEAKIDGSLPAALRQVDRYVQIEDCQGVIIAATKQWARGADAYELRGKPVRVVRLRPQAF